MEGIELKDILDVLVRRAISKEVGGMMYRIFWKTDREQEPGIFTHGEARQLMRRLEKEHPGRTYWYEWAGPEQEPPAQQEV